MEDLTEFGSILEITEDSLESVELLRRLEASKSFSVPLFLSRVEIRPSSRKQCLWYNLPRSICLSRR